MQASLTRRNRLWPSQYGVTQGLTYEFIRYAPSFLILLGYLRFIDVKLRWVDLKRLIDIEDGENLPDDGGDSRAEEAEDDAGDAVLPPAFNLPDVIA